MTARREEQGSCRRQCRSFCRAIPLKWRDLPHPCTGRAERAPADKDCQRDKDCRRAKRATRARTSHRRAALKTDGATTISRNVRAEGHARGADIVESDEPKPYWPKVKPLESFVAPQLRLSSPPPGASFKSIVNISTGADKGSDVIATL